jgi:hypothetical protein
MAVFVYDNTKIDEFVGVDQGSILISSSENIDYGDINQAHTIERDANYFNVDDWGEIRWTADIVPFGPIAKITSLDTYYQVIFPSDSTVLFDVGAAALTSPVRIWIGTGTIHEIGSGLERLVIPDLGAAGPVIFNTSGVATESLSKGLYTGSGAIAKSGLSATELDQVYPWNGSGTLTVSGGTTTPDHESYLPVIKNAAKIKGGYGRQYKNERVIYDYSRDPRETWTEDDYGSVTTRQGSTFGSTSLSFDATIEDALAKETSFSDTSVITGDNYGLVTDTPTGFRDDGVIERKFGGQISLHEYQATGVGAIESRPFHFTGSGSIFKLAEATDVAQTPVVTGSGTGWTFTGENWFSQAPQSTVFGVGDTVTVSGSAKEEFIAQTPESTVLYGVSGDANTARSRITTGSKNPFRITGSVSDISLVTGSGDKSGTVLYNISGGYTDLKAVKADGNINLFDITGGMTQGKPVFTPSWFSPLGDQVTEELDWGLISATPTQPSEDWNVIVTNDETIPKEAENWGYLLPDFNWAQLGGQHYPNLDSLSTGESAWIRQTSALTGTATFLLSEDPDVAAALSWESSGKSGIATHNAGIFISGELWLSQAPQHTVFGEEGEFTISGTGGESITPVIPEGSGTLFAVGGSAESTTKSYLQGDYTYIGGNADIVFSPAPVCSGDITLKTGREEGQTYLRIIDLPDDRFGGTFNMVGEGLGQAFYAYNTSSLFIGQTNENYGKITNDPAYGWDLNQLGQASGTETFDDETNRYSQDLLFSNGGLTYDQGSGGVTVLPSFDKTNSYSIDASVNVVSQNWGILGDQEIEPRSDAQYTQETPHFTGFKHQSEGTRNGLEDFGWVNETAPTANRYPFETPIKIVDSVPPAKTQWIPKYHGKGPLIVTGLSTAIERVSVASSNTTLFDFVGTTSPEKFVAQTPDNTVLYDTSGTLEESVAKDWVGLGTVSLTKHNGVGFTTYRRIIFPPSSGIATFSGASGIRWSGEPPIGTYLHIIGGAYSGLKLSYASQAQKVTTRLYGATQHPQIDYTPHYGIDRNIGIETGITLSPGGGTDRVTGITTASFIPNYPGGQSTLDGKGGNTHEVLTLSGRSISRTNAPISTHGVIYILGIGTAGNGVGGPDENGDLEGVEFGAKERFIPATEYGYGSLMFDFTGTAPNRVISVFGYYGDDRDPGAGTSGQITLRNEGAVGSTEKLTVQEVGISTYNFSGAYSDLKAVFREVGSGSLYSIGGISESAAAAELVAGTSIFNGTAQESFIAQTPENTANITLSGTANAFRQRIWVGTGNISLSNTIEAVTGIRVSLAGNGSLFGFGSAAEAIPYQGFASSVLVDFAGEAETREIANYGYYGDDKDPGTSGILTFSGALSHPLIDFTPAPKGSGLFQVGGSLDLKVFTRESGIGTATFSGSSTVRFISQAGEGTILYDLKGASAITKLHWVYQDFVTSGIVTVSTNADTVLNQNFGYYGDDKDPGTSGKLTISGKPLIHPDVRFIPHVGIGVAVLYDIGGGSTERRAWAPVYGTGSFKKLASLDEAYARTSYQASGQINVLGVAPTEILVFEEGRTYVVII